MRRAFGAAVLAAGGATFLFLLWRFEPARVWAAVSGFGWGFAALLAFPAADHALNATGWRLAFPAWAAPRTDFLDLMRVRVAGDGVNYLTPSGNVAGEFVRPGMLRADIPGEVKVASVFTAKAAQSAGQALFILLGLFYILLARFADGLTPARAAAAGGLVALILFGVGVCVWLIATPPHPALTRRFPSLEAALSPVRSSLRDYLSRHPARLAASTAAFMAGYAWGAAEIWLISSLLGLGLPLRVCLAVEFLSCAVDAAAFMVPAKVGTQEAGKAAIFAGLGLRAADGFTVGILRHVRELAWAGAGMLLFAAHRRREARAAAA